MVSDMDAMFSCILNLCDVRMCKAITCNVPRGYLKGPPEKKKSLSGGSFIRGKSVKEELNICDRKNSNPIYGGGWYRTSGLLLYCMIFA